MRTSQVRHLLDTNIFNRLLDGKISKLPSDWLLTASSVQRFEIGRTKDQARRRQLEALFNQLTPSADHVPTSSFFADASLCDVDTVGASGRLEAIIQQLDQRSKRASNGFDAALIEMALDWGLVIVTCDRPLRDVATALGVAVKYLDEPVTE